MHHSKVFTNGMSLDLHPLLYQALTLEWESHSMSNKRATTTNPCKVSLMLLSNQASMILKGKDSDHLDFSNHSFREAMSQTTPRNSKSHTGSTA